MKKQIQILILAASLVGLFATQASFAAGNIAAGAEKSKACEACHGAGGNAPTTPDFPRLAGQHAEYIETQLKGFRAGERQNFRFDAADPFAMNAMSHLVLAAHAGETKIGIRTAAEVDGILIVRELESRPKLGKTG